MSNETKTKTGGPAFPCETRYVKYNPGMSLRDYFAAKAIQGMLAHGEHAEGGWKRLVAAAYSYADAMLEERIDHDH